MTDTDHSGRGGDRADLRRADRTDLADVDRSRSTSGSWYGPTGATIPVAKMDVRVGGARLICMEMQTPNGPMQMWFAGEYLEVVENERLVYTEAISDEDGNPVDAVEHGHARRASRHRGARRARRRRMAGPGWS